MAEWKVSPSNKKSIEEHELWEKDGLIIRRITGWRNGSWIVTTNDDEEPDFDRGDEDFIDINSACNNNIEEIEMEETVDGWYDDVRWPDSMDEEEQARLEELWNEESYDGWEGDGWIQTDTEMLIWGDLNIEKVE